MGPCAFSCSCKSVDLSVKSITVPHKCTLKDTYALTYLLTTNINMRTQLSTHA